MKNLPQSRTENLVEQNLGAETLIYDLLIHKAFNLNETSSIIYKACDGKMSFDELKRKHKFTDDFIFLALDELKKNNLLANESYVSPFAGMNRREVIRKVGLASMIALPMISASVAPTAANAASGLSGPSGFPASCANGGVIGCTSFQGSCSHNTDCSEGFCYAVNDGMACCDVGGADTYRSGQTYEPPFTGPYILVPKSIGAPANGTNNCSSVMTCCDSRPASGSCNYTYVTDSVEGDQELYQIECTCTCP